MFSLVPDYADSSPESSSEDSDVESAPERSPPQIAGARLPPPTFSDKVKNSVFLNPYLEAENAKIAVLETHVKTMAKEEIDISNKLSKVCWMFKKGKCNFGKKCRFSHNLNGAVEAKPTAEETPEEAEVPVTHVEPALPEDEDEDGAKKRKKRPGLTRGLIPSKKVIKLYKKHKKEDGKS